MKKRHPHPRRGVAAVEMAVVSPLFVILLLGLWEVGSMVEAQQLLNNAVREGGRQASTGVKTSADVQKVVVDYLKHNGITGITTSNVTVKNLTNPKKDPADANSLDQIQVSVSVPFDNVRWNLLNQVTNVKTLTATTTWSSMADVPLTVNMNIPLN